MRLHCLCPHCTAASSNADLFPKSWESPRVSKRDEKLDTLLRAIETYDRSVVSIVKSVRMSG